MSPLKLVGLGGLMERTNGSPEVRIGLIDGPVLTTHPDLSTNTREVSGRRPWRCTISGSPACLHGTFIAGILFATRNSPAPAICPGCTILIRSIFSETACGNEHMPSATPLELAEAIIECMDAGACVVNLSLAIARPSGRGEQMLEETLNEAARRGVILVAASGNQGAIGSSAITRHPAVLPVVACDLRGRPMKESNLGSSIGRRGLSAPGDSITSLGAEGQSLTLGGTSVAVPFVTGAIALLWSVHPAATAAEMKLAITRSSMTRRTSVVPPLLDASAACRPLRANARI